MKNFDFVKMTSLFLMFAANVVAQMPQVPALQPEAEVPEDFTWWYIMLFVLVAGLVGAIIWMVKSKKAKSDSVDKSKKVEKKPDDLDGHSFDADKEMEWLRKNKKIINKRGNKIDSEKRMPKNLPQASNILKRNGAETSAEELSISSDEELQEKLEKLQYSQLPVARIEKIELARPFSPLPLSNDQALMSAIEQVQDEYEEDEEVRDLALRILAVFKTRNSVESLSQIALYDLSSNLRSKAVTTLTEFDHESVFEPILLACADPTREVRAAAARGLFRLSFDRADAWTRIAETGDEFKMRQSARAAIEADLVKRSFDRLAHTDLKSAYEAVTLVALLLRAGETREVFDVLKNHPVLNVRKAILQIIKITKEPNSLEGLYSLLEKNSLPADLQKEVDETIQEIGLVMA